MTVAPGLLRFEELRLWRAVTTDQVTLPVVDLLLDDAAWTVDFFELEIENLPFTERCLVGEDFVIGVDPQAERLDLSVDSDALRRVPRRHRPAGMDCEERMLECRL